MSENVECKAARSDEANAAIGVFRHSLGRVLQHRRQPAEALRANFAFRGVKLEPGKHEIEWRYRSPWLMKGLLFTGASVLLLLGGLALYRRLPASAGPDPLADA